MILPLRTGAVPPVRTSVSSIGGNRGQGQVLKMKCEECDKEIIEGEDHYCPYFVYLFCTCSSENKDKNCPIHGKEDQ